MSYTTESGTYSVRGSIIDIYPINENCAYRIDFFDNEIEKIKKIDIETQLSTDVVKDIVIFPLYEMFYEKDEINGIVDAIKKNHGLTDKTKKDIEKIQNYESLDQLYIYLPYIDKDYVPFISLSNCYAVFYEEPNRIFAHEEQMINETASYFLSVKFKTIDNFFMSVLEAIGLSKKNIYMNKSMSKLDDIKLDKFLNLNTVNNYEYNNNMKLLLEDLKINHQKTYILTHDDDKKLSFLMESLNLKEIPFVENDNKIEIGKINVVAAENAYGFIDLESQTEILTPNEFAPGKVVKRSKYQKYYNYSTKIYDKNDIKAGDYVVHQDYGIGIYKGIKTIELRGNKNDYLEIEYQNDGKLFVPVENIYLLEKYIGSDDAVPKLNKVDGKEWSKKKKKIEEKVIDVAKQIIKVQAEREVLTGYQYKEDSNDQLAFEADFGYSETADQVKAIEDVKRDMESIHPVDRLICGDVGFGKTEVAMRAAFKAVDNGKQVAYLAPTTVLTRQHYYNFKERFEKYGVRVELLNRFVQPAQQKVVLDGLAKGYVDIVIGTHRILSKDIKFKDLGLLIIDEEQRFGVTHKERIKEIKSTVDVLTLTATPIPRTLQMALSGLRDLSLIETPPVNRLPVQTYVLESNDSVIREAINRELSRNGQVFYLLNRIGELDRIVRKINRLVPRARVGVIHGKLDKDEIENELNAFLERDYDVLVCTTIIETGIDIPNANTLLIEKANILGLSQLYQIRGRVGRSDRISYAYLMYDSKDVVTDSARMRLEAIKEFTELGSGYKIAMRDLAIRGAGDILGSEQSGFIDAIGMDLYMNMLNSAIDDAKGVKKAEENEKKFNINVSKHIDKDYIDDDTIRIQMHQSINKIRSRKQLDDLIYEYTDRYGKLSKEITTYMYSKYLDFLLKSKGIEQFKDNGKIIEFNFDPDATSRLDMNLLGKVGNKIAPLYMYGQKLGRFYVALNPKDYKDGYIYTLVDFLEAIKFKDKKVKNK